MATRAVYSFAGFAESPLHHLYLHHDGYPTGAAWRFAMALRHDADAEAFPASFRATQPEAQALESPEQAGDAEYRYRVERRAGDGAAAALWVACWRRLPGERDWRPRCAPMAMRAFIERFLPGEEPPG